MERLQKIIANYGYCSRRKAEELILAGKVMVNGVVVDTLGAKASLSDSIVVEGKSLKEASLEYVLLYKPRGVISSASDDKGRKTVLDIVKSDNRLYPVGRLDYDTSGLILLTNDGKLTNLLTHPSYEFEKTYIAKINEAVIPSKVKLLSSGVLVDGKKTARAKVRIKKIDRKNHKSIIELTIHEGRYHQVKKMFSAIGYEVASLKRERYGFLTLDGLTSGEYRFLSIKEVKKLYNLANNKTNRR